ILPMITIVTIPFLIKVMVPGKSTKNTLDIVGIVLMSISIICFMLFTTNYNWTFLILFTIFFVIFIKHISRVFNSFINPKLVKNKIGRAQRQNSNHVSIFNCIVL